MWSDPVFRSHVTFTYDDQNINFSKGKTTKVSSSVSETKYTSFDNVGRLLTHQQITDGQTYSTGYVYNLSGALIEQTYPSGRTVKNVIDNDGELSIVRSRKTTSHGYWNYADGFTYNASGAVEKMQLGSGRWETASFNNRMQVTQIGLGVTNNTQNLLKLEFDYEGANPGSTVSDRNNGSMREQKITVPTVGESSGFIATQTYSYDGLNRLGSATENISSAQTWKQTFSYDRYGNRRFNTESNNTTTLPENFDPDVFNPTISTSTNRLASSRYQYDENGSLTVNAEGQQFSYNAESLQKEVKDSQNNVLGQYIYDGEGRRVKRLTATDTTIFVYNAIGQLVAEYSTQIETTNAQVSYLTTDMLGSPRVLTDENGIVTSRKDFAPFGEETVTEQRISALGYNPPNIRQDFTGYEKDEETGLEYAKARYFSQGHGRFTSVDPLTSSGAIKNPQTFNRYSYGLNNPYVFTDPLGLKPCKIPGGGNTACIRDDDDPKDPEFIPSTIDETVEVNDTSEGCSGFGSCSMSGEAGVMGVRLILRGEVYKGEVDGFGRAVITIDTSKSNQSDMRDLFENKLEFEIQLDLVFESDKTTPLDTQYHEQTEVGRSASEDGSRPAIMSKFLRLDANTSVATAPSENNNIQIRGRDNRGQTPGKVTFERTAATSVTARFRGQFVNSLRSNSNTMKLNLITKRSDYPGLQRQAISIRVLVVGR